MGNAHCDGPMYKISPLAQAYQSLCLISVPSPALVPSPSGEPIIISYRYKVATATLTSTSYAQLLLVNNQSGLSHFTPMLQSADKAQEYLNTHHGVLGEGWTEVETFDDLDDGDGYETEEEVRFDSR